MELLKNKYKMRCEMGACKNFAGYSVKMSRLGPRGHLNLCAECLRELYELIGKQLTPKGIGNVLKKKLSGKNGAAGENDGKKEG